jgi:uncharacterized tellurite resistance protein B-like protein
MEEKLEILRQLYEMTKADGEIKPVEYQFLYEMAVSMEVPLEKLEEMFELEKNYKIPKQQVQRVIQIYRLALMMRVDKDIAEAEKITLKKIALQMNLHPEAVDQMLIEIENKKEHTLSFDELFQIFKVLEN